MNWLFEKFRRQPDFVIGGRENPYMYRWWIIPRNRFFNIYLHKFLRDDDDRALHDHPWHSCSVILKGGYIEIMPSKNKFIIEKRWAHEPQNVRKKIRRAGMIVFRRATQAHRVKLLRGELWYVGTMERVLPCWTLFITGPRIREWGFWCEGRRFVHWEQFTSPKDKGQVGRGCQ